MRGNDNQVDGWPLTDGPTASAAAASAPAPRLSMQEIDDGWVLPDESTPAPAEQPVAAAAPAEQPAPAAPASRLDLNRATQEDLCALPGIGRLRARRILALRENLGGFSSAEELSQVKGIGAQTLEALLELVMVASAEPAEPEPEPEPAHRQPAPSGSWPGGDVYPGAADPARSDRADQSVA